MRHVTITFTRPVAPAPFSAIDGVRVQDARGPVLRLSATQSAMDAVVKVAAHHELVDLVSAPADLEEIFLDLYRDGGDGR